LLTHQALVLLSTGQNRNPSMATVTEQLELARLLVSRLERLSADSYWAHQSSGLRGSLLRLLEQAEAEIRLSGQEKSLEAGMQKHLEWLTQRGFKLLEKAAREIPAPQP
jgi:hypothetical protein